MVDASVLVHALGDDGDLGRKSRAAIAVEQLHAPAMFDLEVLSAWRRHVARGLMSESAATTAITALKELQVTTPPHSPLVDRIWELRRNLTTHDAAYVAMAEQLDAPLLTADAKLVGAPGTHCVFRLIA